MAPVVADVASPTLSTEHWVHLGLLALVFAQVMLLWPMFGPGEPMGGDLMMHYSEAAHIRRALLAGDANLWNPSGNLGFPSGYYYQIVPQAIPAVLSILVGGTIPLLWLFKFAMALPIVLLPVTAYRAFRVVDVNPTLALAGASGASLVFAQSTWGTGVDSMFTGGLYTQAWAMLFYPLAVARCAQYLQHGTHLRSAVANVLWVGLCHPFVAICLPIALACVPWWRSGITCALKRFLLLGGLVLAASSFFWLPIVVHYDSFGAFPSRFPSERGFALGDFIANLTGGRFLDDRRRVLGVVFPVLTVGLIPASLLALRRPSIERVLLGQGAAFGSLMVAGPTIGKVGEDLLPAVRFLAPMQLALGAAGAIGLVAVVRAGMATRGRARRTPVRRIALGIGATLVAVGTLLGSITAARARVMTSDSLGTAQRAELASFLDGLRNFPPGRVLAPKAGPSWVFLMYLPFAEWQFPSLHAFGGAAVQSSPNISYLQRITPSMWKAYGVRYVVAPKPVQWLVRDVQTAYESEHFILGRFEGPGLFLPIQVVGELPEERHQRTNRVVSWLDGSGPASREYLATGGPIPGPMPHGRVVNEWSGFSEYGADVEATGPTPTTFALSVSYHPGWHASSDGQPVTIRRTSPDIMAVDVPPGTHRLKFWFRRPVFSWVLLAGTLVAFATSFLVRRRPRYEGEPHRV